jgi:CDK-activating kinase assembly factor MAT1
MLGSFNRREEEFKDLRAYNDYLEQVEDISFNLINNIDVAATRRKLNSYAAANSSTISRNSAIAELEHKSLEEQEAAKREISRLNREAARREEEDEKQEREVSRREMMNRIAEGKGDPEDIAREGQRVVLKHSTARRQATDKARQQQLAQDINQVKSKDFLTGGMGNGAADPTFFIKGLKPVVMPEVEKPYDPFGGLYMEPSYYTLAARYEHTWLDPARADPKVTVGGYTVTEYCARALLESNIGLCCFIADEKAQVMDISDAAVATAGAAVAAG